MKGKKPRNQAKTCVECQEFERHCNFGICTKFGWEIGIELAKKDKVCKGVETTK